MVKEGFQIRKARRNVLARLLRLGRHDDTRLLILAVVVGVVSSYAAILFWELFDAIRELTFGTPSEIALVDSTTTPWWLILLVPSVGGLCIGLFVYYLLPDRRPHALADVIEAVATRDGRLSLRAGLGAAIVSAASIGVGASVGREGPIVHLCATIGSWISARLKLNATMLQTLLGCGTAAGVAASFNAPIAGAFFALEVVLGHYALRSFAPVVIASVTGTLIYRLHLGNQPAFVKPEYIVASLWEFPAFALLGVVSAGVALVFMWSLMTAQNITEKIPVPPWLRPAIAGLLVGLIALAFPQILGVGYSSTNAALNQLLPLWLLLALIPAKIIATAASLGGGFGGGVFSPALFIGAMTGGAFGFLASGLFPHLSSGHGAYALIGMGAVAAAVLNAPMSTILIVFELTGDYAATIAVMVAVVIASVITHQVIGGSFFDWQLRRRGIDVTGSRHTRLLRHYRVDDVMDVDFAAISPDAGVKEVRRLLQKAPHGELFVVDEAETLIGTITFQDLREAAFDTGLDDTIKAGDLADLHPKVLIVSDDLGRALQIFENQDDPHIPVVDSKQSMKFLGLVHERDVILRLNRAIAGNDLSSHAHGAR
ncbi:MAG: CBS domain-containing protein [Alphaproteobacteria bacterium]|nr:CBS domain-containing protein [Alphaproteobacteria bacterium]